MHYRTNRAGSARRPQRPPPLAAWRTAAPVITSALTASLTLQACTRSPAAPDTGVQKNASAPVPAPEPLFGWHLPAGKPGVTGPRTVAPGTPAATPDTPFEAASLQPGPAPADGAPWHVPAGAVLDILVPLGGAEVAATLLDARGRPVPQRARVFQVGPATRIELEALLAVPQRVTLRVQAPDIDRTLAVEFEERPAGVFP